MMSKTIRAGLSFWSSKEELQPLRAAPHLWLPVSAQTCGVMPLLHSVALFSNDAGNDHFLDRI